MAPGVMAAVCLTVTSVFRARLMAATIIVATCVSALFGLAVIYIGNPFWAIWLKIAAPWP